MAKKPKPPTRKEILAAAIAADDELVVARAGKGKPMPKWRRQQIETELGLAKTGLYVGSIVDLCKALCISRPTFYSIRKSKGAPGQESDGSFNVDKWKVFAASNLPRAKFLPDVGKESKVEVEKESDENNREALTLAKMKEELEDLRFDKAVKRGEWLKKSEVDEAIKKANEKFISEMSRRFVQSLPADYAQNSGDETICREINRRALEEAREHLFSGPW